MDTTARCPHGRRIGSCGVCASTPQPPSPSVSLLPAALKYAGHGLPVFPLVPGGKTPLTAHGFKDATTDTTKICEWFSQWPDANIGMPTTAFTALDVDTKNGHRGDETLAQLEAQHGALPETVKQRTWSGGIHYLFLSEPGIRNSAGSLGAGLDVRGEGGYIVVSPSVVNGTPYQWLAAPGERPFARMPQWLIE